MKTKIEIKSVFGKLLFEYEKENNTVRDALLKAIESGADLRCAVSRGANLCGANLRGANLYGADLSGADLNGADLSGAKDIPFVPTYLPEGEFIGWKKLSNGLSNGIIVKLKILSDSKRSRACGDKCRCDKALVLEFQNLDCSRSDEDEYINDSYADCTYKVGEMVYADSWDDNRWNECSHGIHFFIDRQSVVNY